MSLLGAFIAGVTGIDAQSNKMGAVSDNIANTNTVGYKPTEVRFKTLVTPRSTPKNYAPGGVVPTPESRMDLQGTLTASSSPTDLGILGRGFFAVTAATSITNGAIARGAQLAVTRAGSFHLDQNGLLVNAAGFALLGTPTGGALPNALTGLVPVQLNPGPSVSIGGVATTQVALAGNLPATDAVGAQENMTTGVFDALGNAYTLNIRFTKTGVNSWSAAMSSITPASATSAATGTIASSPLGLSFNTTGQLTGGATGSLGTITLSNGQTLSPTFNFQGASNALTAMTQFGGTFAQTGSQQDGKASGFRTGIQVGTDGTVSELYSNGLVLPRFQVPVVTYANPEGLQAETGNVWVDTGASGTLASGNAAINASNTGGAGQITPSTLEQSSVDLANEFSQMIVTQSTYAANTKTITTADQMYQLTTQLR